jgi:hypothetical protein
MEFGRLSEHKLKEWEWLVLLLAALVLTFGLSFDIIWMVVIWMMEAFF